MDHIYGGYHRFSPIIVKKYLVINGIKNNSIENTKSLEFRVSSGNWPPTKNGGIMTFDVLNGQIETH